MEQTTCDQKINYTNTELLSLPVSVMINMSHQGFYGAQSSLQQYVIDYLRFVLAYYNTKNSGNFQDNLLSRKKTMKTFKEIGKFPTKNELNQEEDHYYDLCLF